MGGWVGGPVRGWVDNRYGMRCGRVVRGRCSYTVRVLTLTRGYYRSISGSRLQDRLQQFWSGEFTSHVVVVVVVVVVATCVHSDSVLVCVICAAHSVF